MNMTTIAKAAAMKTAMTATRRGRDVVTVVTLRSLHQTTRDKNSVWWDCVMSTDSASSRPKHPRPSIVTLACVFIAVTAFLTLTELITALMDWATVDMQAGLRPILRQLAAVAR